MDHGLADREPTAHGQPSPMAPGQPVMCCCSLFSPTAGPPTMAHGQPSATAGGGLPSARRRGQPLRPGPLVPNRWAIATLQFSIIRVIISIFRVMIRGYAETSAAAGPRGVTNQVVIANRWAIAPLSRTVGPSQRFGSPKRMLGKSRPCAGASGSQRIAVPHYSLQGRIHYRIHCNEEFITMKNSLQ